MTALLLEMFIFCVRGGCKILMARYTSECASQSPSDKPLLCIQCTLDICLSTWKLPVICGSLACWTTAILSKTLFVWFRAVLEIQLESYSPRHTSVVLWYDIVCVYYKSTYTLLFGMQLLLTTKLTYLMTTDMYYTPNGGFTANDASFYKNKVG